MRPYILLMSVLFLGCRDGDLLQKVTKCGQTCYTLKGNAGVGQCQSGIWHCDDGEESAICERQVGPTTETCDGLDNDCDGQVDESISRSCDSSCGFGQETCTNGVFAGCTAPRPNPETCNGADDDCDGKIDEPEELPLEYCYTGVTGSIQFGQCRPGIQRCELGAKVCYGEVTPRPEVCDGVDNNCDGQVDEGINNNDPVDIVFVIDNSGSMGSTIAAVKSAANNFANTYGARTDLRWALVVAPDPDPMHGAKVRLHSDLDTAAVFAAAMQKMAANGSGAEPTLDAIAMLADPSNPLQVSWRAGSRHVVVMFTDEEPQSYAPTPYTTSMVSSAIQTAGMQTYVFTTSAYTSAWLPALPPTLGQVKTLTTVTSIMENELNTVVEEVSCR